MRRRLTFESTLLAMTADEAAHTWNSRALEWNGLLRATCLFPCRVEQYWTVPDCFGLDWTDLLGTDHMCYSHERGPDLLDLAVVFRGALIRNNPTVLPHIVLQEFFECEKITLELRGGRHSTQGGLSGPQNQRATLGSVTKT